MDAKNRGREVSCGDKAKTRGRTAHNTRNPRKGAIPQGTTRPTAGRGKMNPDGATHIG